MASRRARLAHAQARTEQRTATAQRIGDARTQIEHRSLLAAANPLRDELPDFYATALLTGVVPEPPAVFTQPTTLLPTVKRRSLLGLDDNQEGQDR